MLEASSITSDLADAYAAGLSAKHGDRITGADARVLAREIYEGNPEYPQKTIAEVLSVSQQSISNYIRDLKAKKDEELASKIGVLARLGWTQEEIGQTVGVTRRRVGQILEGIPDLVKLPISRLQSGIPVDEVAEQSGLSIPYAWAMALDLKDAVRGMFSTAALGRIGSMVFS